MGIIKIINEEINNFDYRGEHQAPSPLSNDAPMYNVSEMFPDMYTENATKYYGNNDNDSYSAIYFIQHVKNRPNASVKIYRAVPDINYDITKQMQQYANLLNYHLKYKFFPVGDRTIQSIESKYDNDFENHRISYDELKSLVYNDVSDEYNKLRNARNKPLKINNGDWVTISLNYAKEHGMSNLNGRYKIITKTVRAKDLYTDGNDVLEWGYYGV